MINYSAFSCRMLLICSALTMIAAPISQAAEPRPPSCLSPDGSPPEPGANCCDATPTEYDENGPPGIGTIIGELLPRSDTFHSIGLKWDIDGDADYDSTVSVRYRKAGACNFAPAMPLIRNDYAWYWQEKQAAEPTNNFAGSLMFLSPGTTYEVVLELNDPDGGRAIRVRDLTTRSIPQKPNAGRTLHVVPGNGGGDGSSGNPFQGIAAANAAAIPGDTFLLRDGTYTRTVRLSASGEEDNYVVWEADVGASPVVEAFEITGSHIWIDQLNFVRDGDENAIEVPPGGSPDDIVITHSNFSGYAKGIINFYDGDRWVVMDNTLVGAKAVGVGGTGTPGASNDRGIALGGENIGGGTGHVIAFNSVTRFSDGIGCDGGCDVYGNQVWDFDDDNFSSDGAYENVRVWGNRFHYAAGSAISFQPQRAGPWYFLYNQMAQAGNGIWKWRVQDRIVFVNNTFIGGTVRAQYFMKTITRNNLFIGGSPIWSARDSTDDPFQATIQSPPQWLPSWNTDVDYNGYDWGGDTSQAFTWFGGTERYPDLASFAAAVGIEQHGIRVNRNLIFEDYVVSRDHSLTLNPTGNAVDAGAHLPNLADFYEGAGPDLGAHESGAAPLHYGPRNGTVLHEHELYWAKH